jgi:phosphoribosylaminoimidazole carboxylase PurE protein
VIEIRTGSDSDIPKIRAAHDLLRALGVPYVERILSAHRTPRLMAEEARRLEERGLRVSIAAAGGSAHLPGMTASETTVPVVGIPVPTEHLGGLDSLYSIVQMPDGCPVGTVGIGQAEAGALLAAEIAGAADEGLIGKIRARKGLKGATPAPARVVGLVQPGAAPPARVAELRELLAAFGLEPRDGAEGRVVIVLADAGSLSRPAELAARTHAPVIAVPIAQGKLDRDPFGALLGGAPLAGMGINRYKNAAIYAAQIAGVHDPEVRSKVRAWREKLGEESAAKDAALRRP